MLTLEDCLEVCGLNADELRYLVEHEHISELQAAGLAEKYVVLDGRGVPHLRRIIVEDIRTMKERGRDTDARCLEAFIRDFVISHPHLNHDRP